MALSPGIYAVWRLAVASFLLLQIDQPARQQDALPTSQAAAASSDLIFHFDPDAGAVFIPVTIEGVPRTFLLDSGATAHFLDERYRSILGNPVRTERVRTGGEPIGVEVFRSPALFVGSIAVGDKLPVALVNLSFMSSYYGCEVHGVLGSLFLQDWAIRLDFDRGSLQILMPDAVPDEMWGVAFPFYCEAQGIPYINDVAIGVDKLALLIDTGMNAELELESERFDLLRENSRITSVRTTRARSMGGERVTRWGRLAAMRLGPYQHASITVAAAKSNTLGLAYLARYRVVFDLPHGKLYLAKGESFGKTRERFHSGVRLLWIDDKVVVDRVARYSPAELAGIVKGDVVLEVDGVPATGATLGKVRRALIRDLSAEVSVKLDRGGQSELILVHLQDNAVWNRADAIALESAE